MEQLKKLEDYMGFINGAFKSAQPLIETLYETIC